MVFERISSRPTEGVSTMPLRKQIHKAVHRLATSLFALLEVLGLPPVPRKPSTRKEEK
jgi:hypothetical protein